MLSVNDINKFLDEDCENFVILMESDIPAAEKKAAAVDFVRVVDALVKKEIKSERNARRKH